LELVEVSRGNASLSQYDANEYRNLLKRNLEKSIKKSAAASMALRDLNKQVQYDIALKINLEKKNPRI